MISSCDSNWLRTVIVNIDEDNWRLDNLEDILNRLMGCLSTGTTVLDATYILNVCFDDAMGQGRYQKLIDLYSCAINTFESDQFIPDLTTFYVENPETTNSDKFFTEYFDLKLNLTHAKIMRHSPTDTRQQLQELETLLPRAKSNHQRLQVYLLFLKYKTFGHQINLPDDIITEIRKLSPNTSLRVEALIALGYHNYDKGDISDLENTIHNIKKVLGHNYSRYPNHISRITAEHYVYMATVYMNANKLDKAEEYLDIALSQATYINHFVQMMLVLSEKATLYVEKNDLKEAQHLIDRAYQKYLDLPEQQDYQEARIDHIRGNIRYKLQKYDHALTSFQRVLPIWERYEREFHVAQTHNALGATFIKLNLPEQAEASLTKARQLCYTMNDKTHVDWLLQIIDENFNDLNNILPG